MAHNISNEYKQIIYSGDARNKLKLLFNNVELQDADRYCEKLTVKSRIIPNGAKIFNLNNFISKEADLILHDIDTSIIQNQVSISIGTLVGNSYEYVPIGIFNIENQPTNDKNKTTIKLRDNSVKFDFNYNAQPLIEQNGGVATKLQILQDICTQVGVTCNITSFVGYLDEIGVYDNTITARQYISRIAEQAGKIATINRSGELIFVDLNNLTTWEIPIEIVEKYENGTKFKIGKVVYEDGIIRYETPTSNDDTLFLDGSNNYINGELVKEQASSSDNSYYLENTGEADLAYFELEGKTEQETRSGINLLNVNVASGTTSHGITLTVNKDKSITLNGTNDGDTSWLKIADNFTLPAGTYTLSNGNLNAVYSTAIFMDDGHNFSTANTTTATFSSSVTIVPYIRVYSGVTLNNLTIYPMIVKGSYTIETMPTYEEYGAMPSPDYPSELVSVGYENIIPQPTYEASDNSRQTDFTWLKELKTGTYTISFDLESFDLGTNTTVSIYFDTFNIGVINSSSKLERYSETINITSSKASSSTSNFRISQTNYNNGARLKITNIQLEKGTQVHSYIPYGKYGIEVKTQGKNLFDKDNATTQAGYFSSNGAINSGGSSTITTSYTSILPNTNMIISGITLEWICFYDKNKAFIKRVAGSSSTFNENAYYIRIQASTSNFNLDTIQLEQNTQATAYEEYKSNTYLYTIDNPLRSIGNTKDLLYIKNGMLYVERKIGSVVLDGSESWFIPWNVNCVHMCSNALTDAKKYSSATKNIICQSNYYPATHYDGGAGSMWNLRNNENYPYLISIVDHSTNAGRIIIKNVNITTSVDFKTWLSTHNTEVQYVLAEPYKEELGQVDMPSTYEGITYIDISSNINTNSYLQYRQNKTQLEAILQNTNQFNIDSLKTGKILGNPAIDSYDLIQITDGNKIFKTLATNDLVYTGVLINTFDTQIGEEAKEQNVFVNGEETFKKWARTTIDNVEGTLTLQAGQIDEANGKINETNLIIEKDGALLNVLANNSNIDVQYDSEGNPLSGEVREVTTTTGFKFNAEGMTIEDTSSNFKAQHRNTGTYYKDGDTIVGQYTKDGSKQKDLDLFGVYTYGKNDIDDTPMFIAQLFTDGNGEECFGHFYNRGD